VTHVPRETGRARRERAGKVIRLLRKAYPGAKCTLDYETVHQLMVATILSAQCTDERVNMVTPGLFEEYRSVQAFAEAELDDLRQAIYTTGFYANKARAIRESARELLERHKGEVPRTLEQLVKLTGVGRKTASVVLGAGYGLAEGIVVDTHVARVSRLLRFTSERTPDKIERDLMKIIPESDWIGYSHLMIQHGRSVCKARRPECSGCVLSTLCPSAGHERPGSSQPGPQAT